jgi:hypothetical protein
MRRSTVIAVQRSPRLYWSLVKCFVVLVCVVGDEDVTANRIVCSAAGHPFGPMIRF